MPFCFGELQPVEQHLEKWHSAEQHSPKQNASVTALQ